jgi:hypothetical protein
VTHCVTIAGSYTLEGKQQAAPEEGIVDIDWNNRNNPLACSEYAAAIFNHLHEAEVRPAATVWVRHPHCILGAGGRARFCCGGPCDPALDDLFPSTDPSWPRLFPICSCSNGPTPTT